MALQADYFQRTFSFNFKARTSRGLMKDRNAFFIRLWDTKNPTVFGVGECGPLPGLSVDAVPDLEQVIQSCVERIQGSEITELQQWRDKVPHGFPAVLFAFETAWLDLKNGGRRVIFDNGFVKGLKIPINGLIWMGDMDFTMSQINIRIFDGFECIKLKVGGLDFDRECDILEYIRKRYYRQKITIRLDANGAFKVDEVLYRLEQLHRYNVHSIEQPIKAGLSEMEELCRKSPIPVALDEELIGKENCKDDILKLKPQFIILKPSLHGGLLHCDEWIRKAEQAGIGWWMTSALESNIGLNAIAQFTANYDVQIPQGLGTGSIYNENFQSPLEVQRGHLFYGSENAWDDTELTNIEPTS